MQILQFQTDPDMVKMRAFEQIITQRIENIKTTRGSLPKAIFEDFLPSTGQL